MHPCLRRACYRRPCSVGDCPAPWTLSSSRRPAATPRRNQRMHASPVEAADPGGCRGPNPAPWTSPCVVVLCGVSGCGKSAVGEAVAQAVHCAFYDADDFHPPSNIAKMAAGLPLTDEDRWPWLDTLAALIQAHAARGERAVVACSALKAKYRARLQRHTNGQGTSPVGMVLLDPPVQQLEARLERRAQQGQHFMPPSLLASQLDTLERPELCTFTAALDPDRGWLLVHGGQRRDACSNQTSAGVASSVQSARLADPGADPGADLEPGLASTSEQGSEDSGMEHRSDRASSTAGLEPGAAAGEAGRAAAESLLLHVCADAVLGVFPGVEDCVRLVQGALGGGPEDVPALVGG